MVGASAGRMSAGGGGGEIDGGGWIGPHPAIRGLLGRELHLFQLTVTPQGDRFALLETVPPERSEVVDEEAYPMPPRHPGSPHDVWLRHNRERWNQPQTPALSRRVAVSPGRAWLS